MLLHGRDLHDLLCCIRRDPAGSTSVDDRRSALDRDGRGTSERLRELADEIQAIEEGIRPTSDDLANAPVLEDWTGVFKALPALSGAVHGHPDFPPGRRITTSDLYGTDGLSWARTLSRYYRLGTPAGSVAARPN
jgi:hypothetical protein